MGLFSCIIAAANLVGVVAAFVDGGGVVMSLVIYRRCCRCLHVVPLNAPKKEKETEKQVLYGSTFLEFFPFDSNIC